ncbi:uncharacterized protein LOC125809547 [Solanum verrucosum]|uniref:uncharacterized protein LOC125809547 n=1 Tax=Solanum verrucosum TaxID=315347 RepID=UPI0020D07A62|nr:uncharacterized protein LOC125809547 [Solanum verrucosum]
MATTTEREFVPKEAGSNMSRIKDMMQKMRRRFDATDENAKKMRNDLSRIGQKVDAHANPKNDGQCMEVTTLGGKQTIDPPMPSGVEIGNSKDDDVVEVSGKSENAIEKEADVTQKVVPIPRPRRPFTQRSFRADVWVFMKDMVTKKRAVRFEDDDRLQHCSAIGTRSLVQKNEDLDAFTIPCTIGLFHFAKALYDLGASINLMPLSIYKKSGLGDPKSTAMQLLMADRTVKRPIGELQDVLVKVESFISPTDFCDS